MKSTLPLFIKNRMILEYKVTLLVLKLLNESYIFSVVFVINFSWRKVYFLFLETGFITPDVMVSVAKIEWKYWNSDHMINICNLQKLLLEASYYVICYTCMSLACKYFVFSSKEQLQKRQFFPWYLSIEVIFATIACGCVVRGRVQGNRSRAVLPTMQASGDGCRRSLSQKYY